MLGLFAAKSDHPLADPKEAKRVFAELAAREAPTAVDEITGWIESLAADDKLRLGDKLAILFQLDEAAQPHARKLGREYLASPRLGRTQEHKLWLGNREFWVQAGAAYGACLERHLEPGKGGDPLGKAELTLLLARYLRAVSTRLKWDQFRYGPISPDLWQGMGRAYLVAEQNKVSRQALVLYPGQAGETTAEYEYLKALVFQASSMDSLLPLEIEIAERVIAHLLAHFTFTAEPRPDNVYWVDAARAVPPTRLAVVPPAAPTLRFLSAGAALARIQALLPLVERGEVPADVNLGGQYSPRILLPVLRHLAMYWAPKPPMRSHDRHRVKSRLTVIHGLDRVHGRLAGRPGAEDCEAWVVDDVSQGGMGAQVPLGPNDWVRIGVLVGLQPEGGNNWLVGVVRRFVRESPTAGAVGIETFSKAPQSVRADLGGMACDAILLDGVRNGETARVLLPGAAFEPAVPLTFNWQGRTARLDPVEQIETGADYDLGLYRAVAAG